MWQDSTLVYACCELHLPIGNLVDTLYRVQSRVAQLEPWSRLRVTFCGALYEHRSHDCERLAAVRSSGAKPPSGMLQMP